MFKKGIKVRVLVSPSITGKEEQEDAEVCDVVLHHCYHGTTIVRHATSSCMRLAWLDM